MQGNIKARPFVSRSAQHSGLQRKAAHDGVPNQSTPFDIINFENDDIGITADYASLISTALHIPVTVKVFGSRQEAIAALARNELDFLATAKGFDQIDKNLVLSELYAEDNPVFARRTDIPQMHSDSINGVSVAMVYNYLPPQWILQAYPGIKLKMYSSNFSAMGSVSFGQNDLFLGDNPGGFSGRGFQPHICTSQLPDAGCFALNTIINLLPLFNAAYRPSPRTASGILAPGG